MSWRDHFDDFVITTPRAQLRVADDELLDALGDAAAHGIAPTHPTPFRDSWDALSSDGRRHYIVARQQQAWAEFSLDRWRLPLAVCQDGDVVGELTFTAAQFRRDKTFANALWLTSDRRGAGLGTEVLRAALHFGFGALAADRALAMTFADNAASTAVIRKTGYQLSGASLYVGGANTGRRLVHYRLDRRRWAMAPSAAAVTVADMCLHFP
jgi:RimJ/RimL family protein N-acetyltransferase